MRFLSKHTEKSIQYYQRWKAKSRMLSEFAVAMELLNTGDTKTAAVISPCVARSCCSCCAQSPNSAATCSILHLWRPVTPQLPAVFAKLSSHWVSLGFLKKNFPNSSFKTAKCHSLNKNEQINKATPKLQLLQVTSPKTVPMPNIGATKKGPKRRFMFCFFF